MIDWLLNGTIPVAGGELFVREVVGNVFGLASGPLDDQTPRRDLEGVSA